MGGSALLNGERAERDARIMENDWNTTRTYLPSGEDDRDCADFTTQAEAQEFFESEGGPDEDPHGLDRDEDGRVCESLS